LSGAGGSMKSTRFPSRWLVLLGGALAASACGRTDLVGPTPPRVSGDGGGDLGLVGGDAGPLGPDALILTTLTPVTLTTRSFGVVVAFTGDADGNGTATLSYCSATAISTCDPTAAGVTLALERRGGLFLATVAGLVSPFDPVGGWIDRHGDLWIYGGWGYDGAGTLGDLGDLWVFSP
jgi:hypothetical protein